MDSFIYTCGSLIAISVPYISIAFGLLAIDYKLVEYSRTECFDMLQTRIHVVPPEFMSVRAIRSPGTGSFSVVA